MQIDPGEYCALELRAHALLAGVPLHDVWAVDLPGRGGEQPMLELRALLSGVTLTRIDPAVRLLFALRRVIGRLSPADRVPPRAAESSFAGRLSEVDRAATLVAPGSREGIFRLLYVFPEEAAPRSTTRRCMRSRSTRCASGRAATASTGRSTSSRSAPSPPGTCA